MSIEQIPFVMENIYDKDKKDKIDPDITYWKIVLSFAEYEQQKRIRDLKFQF